MFGSAGAPRNRLTTDAVKLYRNEIIKVRCRFSEPMNQDPIPFCNRTSSRNAPIELHTTHSVYPLSHSLHMFIVVDLFHKRHVPHSRALSNDTLTCKCCCSFTIYCKYLLYFWLVVNSDM